MMIKSRMHRTWYATRDCPCFARQASISITHWLMCQLEPTGPCAIPATIHVPRPVPVCRLKLGGNDARTTAIAFPCSDPPLRQEPSPSCWWCR